MTFLYISLILIVMMMFVRVFLLDFICFFSLIQLLFTTFCSMLSLLLLTFKVGKHFFFDPHYFFFWIRLCGSEGSCYFWLAFIFLLVCLFICDCFRIWSKWKNLVFIPSSCCCCCCLIVTISLRFFPFYFFTQNPEYEIFLCIEYFAKL